MGGFRVTAEDFDRVPCLDGARALKRDLLAIHKMKETDPSKIKEQMKLYNVRANAKLEDDELRKVTEKVRRRLYTVLSAVTIEHEKREAREAAEERRALLERHIERKIKMRDAFALKFWSEPSEKSTRFLARLRVFKVMQAAVAARAARRAAAEATRRKLQWRRLHKELPIDVLWRDEDGWIRRCEAVVETVTVRYTDAGKVYTQAGVVADDLGPGGFYFGEDDGGGGGDGRRDDGGDGDSCKDGAGAMGLDAGELSVAVISDDDVSDDDVDFDSDDGEDELRRARSRRTAAPPEPSGSSAADAKKAEVVAQMDAALASTARVEPGDRPEFGLPIKAEWLEKILRGGEDGRAPRQGHGQAHWLISTQVHAWVFEDVIVYETFIPYEHPRGAVGWIDLTKAIVERPQMCTVEKLESLMRETAQERLPSLRDLEGPGGAPALSTVENHDDIAAIKASGFSSKKAANGKVKVPDKFQSSASRLCGIFELNVKQRKAFLNFAEARGNKTKEQMIKAGAVSPGTAVLSVGVGAGFGTLGCQAGGLGSSASLSTDNDDERLKLCNEMGVLGRKVAAGVLAVATFESVRPGRHEIVVGARFIWILLYHDTHKQLEAGFVENVPAFFGTPPCDLIISQLKKKGYNVLVHVRVPMTQLKIPSLRERTILRFWRAAPGETPKVTVRKRLVVS
ncbi:hypothetical protein JL720_6413 [Aureococcus anophagefferens]|nr:hypothetical protein JL720_6413 [Aureococcus anophagefferens]